MPKKGGSDIIAIIPIEIDLITHGIGGQMKTRKIIRFLTASITLLTVFAASACAPTVQQTLNPQYYAPLKDANFVSTGATISVRYGPQLTHQNIARLKFSVIGANSGLHSGQMILADDHKTVIFKPADPFTPGEIVNVDINSLRLNSQTTYSPLSYTFKVALNQKPGGVGAVPAGPPDGPPKSAFPDFLTVPQDIPHFTVSDTLPSNSDGDIFVAPFYWTKSTIGSYLLILTPQGKLVYYESIESELSAFDFKKQPNGLLSYFDQRDAAFYVMDSHYQVVDSYKVGNGYTTDLHDLQILPNGNALLMAYDAETMDMSKIVPGGNPDATVTGLIIQELDPSKNVIFEWRSWDHFAITDTTSALTDPQIDLVHGNALALANDGNLLLSSRNQSEITKINLQTGDVIWRLGGKANQFKFIGGQPFAYQHDVRQLPNGDITVFDNHGTMQTPAASAGIEYKIDETNNTATQVWDFSHNPPVFGTFMGNTERLPDGNTFMSWGAPSQAQGFSYVTMTELSPDNTPIFEFTFDEPYVSYRAFLAPWQGFPDTQPTLAFKTDASRLTLGYSWNGATEVASYRVFGGSQPMSLKMIEQEPNTDFEVQSHLTGLPVGECYFQVAALDKNGKELGRSKVVSTDSVKCPAGY